METTNDSFETSNKRINAFVWVFLVIVSLLILHLADLMSVLPGFLDAKIAY